jgi:PhnB protein
MLMRFKESPEPHQPGTMPAGSENKVMHMELKMGDTRVLASDGRCTGKPNFQGFGLALSMASEAEAERAFANLSEGGQVQAPLTRTFFSPKFGMVNDRFGVMWMVLVERKQS